MTENLKQMSRQVKDNIILLLDNSKLQQAQALLEQYMIIVTDDPEAFSMQAVIDINQGRLGDAAAIINKGLTLDKDNFDLLFNLAYIYELRNEYVQSATFYEKLIQGNYSDDQKLLAAQAFEKIKSFCQTKPRLTIFVKQNLDNFLADIIQGLSNKYEIKKEIITQYNQINELMELSDICWFEWCDELIVYASKLAIAKEKKIICRLHRYEAFSHYIGDVVWENIDHIIFVSEHIRDVVINKVKLPLKKCTVVYNGINLDTFSFVNRNKGYNLAWIGYLNLRKNPMMVLQYFYELVKENSKYQLYIAGSFQDEALLYYTEDMVQRLNLQRNVHFDGFIPHQKMNEWLRDKNYIVTGSIGEGHPVGVMEAMASGLKPVIHYFPGAESFYPKEYIYYDLDGFKRIFHEKEYNSQYYRDFIRQHYSLDKQVKLLELIIHDMIHGTNDKLGEYYRLEFEKDSDNISNTEKMFDYLLDKEDEEAYMFYLQEWLVRSNLPTEMQIKFYYFNLYRRLKRYTRFQYMSEMPYEKLVATANSYMKNMYPKYFGNKQAKLNPKNSKVRVLFLLNGLDYNQIVTQFYVDLIKESKNTNFEYHILSILDKNEFRNIDLSLAELNEAKINYYIPQSSNYEDRLKEFYSYIAKLQPDIAMFQSLYFAPLNIMLYPLLKKICKCTGRFIHQQPEPYFDRELDFISWYITQDSSVIGKDVFDFPWPIKTHIADKKLDIRAKIGINKQQKIVVSLARDIYFRDNKPFWDFIIKMVTEIPDVTFVVFGPTYDGDYKRYIPEILINEKKIVFCGFDLNAVAYLSSCDYFLNTFPIGGGSSLQEAYYAGLPMITFILSEGNRVDLERNSYLIPLAWYKDAIDIFPKHGDFEELFEFAKKLICDETFEKYILSKRKFATEDMTYAVFAKKFEEYLMNKINS